MRPRSGWQRGAHCGRVTMAITVQVTRDQKEHKKKLYQGIVSYCMENTSHMAKGEERTTKDFSLPFLRH